MNKLLWLCLPLLLLGASLNVLAQEGEKKQAEDSSEPEPPAVTEEGETEEEAEEEAPEPAEVGKKAPGFTLKNADGDDVSLSDYADKIVVLEWINLDCPWCKAHYEKGDELVKLQKELREDGVVWLQICSNAEGKQGNFDDETLKKRIEKVDLENEYYLKDYDGKVGKKYAAATTPHCYVIDKEGKLRYAGALDNLRDRRRNKDLEAVNYVKLAVEALQNDKEIDTTETKPYG